LAQDFFRRAQYSSTSPARAIFEHFARARVQKSTWHQSIATAPRASFVTREGTISQMHSGAAA
jgi:hypothetical protein